MKYKLGFVGVGNMGGAILNKILENKVISPQQIIVCDINNVILESYKQKNVHITENLTDIFDNTKFVIIAVKPQTFRSLNFSKYSIKSKCLISIMAGIKVKSLKKILNFDGLIVRAMPNLPCLIGHGVTGVNYPQEIKEKDKCFIDNIFASCGSVIIVEESKFDALTSISGSGPAYVFYFLKCLIESGITMGLNEEESRILAIQTFLGSSIFAKQSKQELNELIDTVCSKGGTTIEAINIFKSENIKDIVLEGVKACKKRSEEISEE